MSDIKICNPLLRIPLSLIIDDSCPVINKAYYWIQQRHDWRIRHRPNTQPRGWEVHYNRLSSMPNTIPVIDNVSIVDFLKRRGRDKSKINIYPTASLTKNLEGTNMTEFGLLQKINTNQPGRWQRS